MDEMYGGRKTGDKQVSTGSPDTSPRQRESTRNLIEFVTEQYYGSKQSTEEREDQQDDMLSEQLNSFVDQFTHLLDSINEATQDDDDAYVAIIGAIESKWDSYLSPE